MSYELAAALEQVARLIRERDFWKRSYEQLHVQFTVSQYRFDVMKARFDRVMRSCKKEAGVCELSE